MFTDYFSVIGSMRPLFHSLGVDGMTITDTVEQAKADLRQRPYVTPLLVAWGQRPAPIARA